MKDPTIPASENRKKLMFYDSLGRQTKLRIRCDFDGFTQSQFFRMMITGYIENNDLICDYIRECKEKYGIQGQQKRNKIDQIQKKAEETNKKFKLEGNEIENIFDILEMDTDI